MSLRWIQATREAPTCDEESSDIDDSDGSDDSCDSDLSLDNYGEKGLDDRLIIGKTNGKSNGRHRRENNKRIVPCVLWDPRKPMQNPVYRSALIKLLCRTGYHLIMSESGRVLATSSAHNRQGLFIVSSVSFGVVRIQSPETGRYLAFNKKGHLYAEIKEKDNTEWEQWSIGNYEAFRSRKYIEQSWWIGIKKNGRAKSGPSTAWGQKSIQFVIIGCD